MTLYGLPVLSVISCTSMRTGHHTKTNRHTHTLRYLALHTVITIGKLITGILDISALCALFVFVAEMTFHICMGIHTKTLIIIHANNSL